MFLSFVPGIGILIKRQWLWQLVGGYLCWLVAVTALAAGAKTVEAPLQGKSTQYQQVYKLPAWIDAVISTCRWKTEGGSGYVRVIRTHETFGHGLYLQWMRFGLAGEPPLGVATVQVEELWRDIAVRFEMPTTEFRKDHCLLQSMAESTLSEQRMKLALKVRGPGDYELGVTRQLKSGY